MDNKEDQPNSQLAVVTGSAWIQQRSKSYGHRIYYFNTETGEAVWNLSHAEIEKAQKTMQNVISSPKLTFEGCPEPKQPPKEPPNCNQIKDFKEKPSPSKIYNKQIINNSFTRQPYPITAVIAPNCSHGMPPSGLPIPGQSTTALSIPASAFKYNIWTVPSVGHQIFIAPMDSPNVQQISTNVNAPTALTQTSECLANSNVRQDNDMTEQNCAPHTFTESRSPTSPRHFQNEKYIPKANKTIFDGRAQVQTEVENMNKNFDLRQFLASKRRRTQKDMDEYEDIRSEGLSVTSYEGSHQDNTSNAGILPLNDIGDESCYSDADSDWLEDNLSVDGNKLRLDVTSLKRLASSNCDPDCWYIAVDKTILLRHLNFLNTLYNSDEQCHLMVPRAVLAELRAESQIKSMRRASKRASRAVAFVSQQSDSGIAIIGAGACEDSDIEIPHVLNCCFKLAEQYYHVVLISNDHELQRYKNNPSVPIFSIKELKEYLENIDQCEEEEENVETDLLTRTATPPPDIEKVKIVISNDLITSNPETAAPGNVTERYPSDINFRSNKSQNRPQEETKHLSISLKSYMIDAGIQTVEQTVHNSSANHTANIAKINNAQTSCTVTDPKARDSTLSRNILSKVRLKRSISNPPVACIAASVEKKQFKWRRRRVTQASESNSTRNPNKSSKKADVPAFTEANAVTTETFKGDDSLKIQKENSETSSASIVQKNLSEKLAVEETSTSGVISNTTSNVDSIRSSVDKETVNKNVMFEVTDHSMEEYLTMRCDEWSSRYVQIMEEVLSQVLHQYPQFLPNLTPPPWALHEATECIGIMFRDKRDVTEAVKKLLKVLENVYDDTKSGIRVDIRPSDYMQLYSYGVYLVEILQLVVKNCEDLQTAADSLSKLLYDIKNPNLDSSHNDSFLPVQAASTATQVPKGMLVTEAENKNQADTKDRTEVLADKNQEYNLRSKKRKLVQEDEKLEQQDTTIIRYIDIDFFKSLNLQRNMSDLTLQMCNENINYIQQDVSNDKQLLSLTANSQSCSSKNLSCTGDREVEDKNVVDRAKQNNTGTVEPKFVRKFSTCPEFEKRMENTPMPLCIDEPQYTDYYVDNNYDYIEDPNYTESDDYYDFQENQLQDCETRIEDAFENENCEQANPEVNINSISNVKCFRQIMNETKQAIEQVTVFCQKCSIDLTNGHSFIKKIEMLKKAKQAYQCIDDVHKKLSSIIMRQEKLEPENNVHSVLRKAGVDSFDVSDLQVQKYGDIIEKYLTQARSLLAVINIIIATVKS